MQHITLFLILLLGCAAAGAHERSESWSVWSLNDTGLNGVVTIAAREITRIPAASQDPDNLARLFADYAATRIEARSHGTPCAPANTEPLLARAGYLRLSISIVCSAAPTELEYSLMFDVIPSHVHFARRLTVTGGDDRLLSARERHWTFDTGTAAAATKSGFGDFFSAGLRHISGGLDHIAFLAALLLVAGSLRSAVIAVSGFTMGHSITLLLGSTGALRVQTGAVEALIGASIALVALEYYGQRHRILGLVRWPAVTFIALTGIVAIAIGPHSMRTGLSYLGLAVICGSYLTLVMRMQGTRIQPALTAAMSIVFGLLHGFGFAGFLSRAGLEPGAMLVPLAGFNIGVEAGQLLWVGAMLAIGAACARFFSKSVNRALTDASALALCTLGVFWYVGRSL